MLKKPHDFVNREGERIELLCEMDHANGQLTYKKVILPSGTKIRPQFLWGNQYIFITYKEDSWYLFH
ncbi:MAG: hypothetical protein EOO69_11605 [Moraxellaceae bacterium]|nr:MAG: hypothetical protein EOO69_11605 [Moraxellaceae bacterium]